MFTTRHPVDVPYTRQELEALFRDARAAAVNMWSYHWTHPATWEEPDTIGTFSVRWGETPALWPIECDEGFSLEELMQELGRLELAALGRVQHGEVPREEG